MKRILYELLFAFVAILGRCVIIFVLLYLTALEIVNRSKFVPILDSVSCFKHFGFGLVTPSDSVDLS